MPLREELQASGTYLFRWRSYLPLAALALVVTQTAAPLSAPMWKWVAVALAAFGLAVRGYVVGHVPRGSSGRNTRRQICEELNTTGAYSVVRHPLYLGNSLIWLGVSLYPGVWWLTLMMGLVFWLYYERIMYAEEEFLRAKFGERYMQWARRTPAFVPSLRSYTAPRLPFSIRTVLRGEYSSWLAVVATFALLDASVDGPQPGPLAVALVVYFALRSVKTRTTWLDVEGR